MKYLFFFLNKRYLRVNNDKIMYNFQKILIINERNTRNSTEQLKMFQVSTFTR